MPEDVATVRSSEIMAKLELVNLDLILGERRIRWFGHVEHSRGAVRTACDIQADGRRGQGGTSLLVLKRNGWRTTAVSGRLRQSNLKKGAPKDQL